MKQFKTIRKIMLLPFLLMVMLVGPIWTSAYSEGDARFNIDAVDTTSFIHYMDAPIMMNEVSEDSIAARKDLTEEVRKFISKNLNKKYARHIEKLTDLLVDKAIGNDIDLTFILAQTQQETAFGTTGIGRSKKSLFGIYKNYRTYEESIDHYIKVLKKSYLVGHKTEHHLMKNFVNKSGRRYAGDLNYESHLRTKYKNISRTTRIPELQERYKKYI